MRILMIEDFNLRGQSANLDGVIKQIKEAQKILKDADEYLEGTKYETEVEELIADVYTSVDTLYKRVNQLEYDYTDYLSQKGDEQS